MKKILIAVLVTILTSAVQVIGADVQTIDKDELKQLLGSADLVVLDVRTAGDWDSSEYKITGALRADPSDVEDWADDFSRDKTYVLYCA